MKIKYKQTQPYGCGMYAVANALNIDNYISLDRLQQSQKGNSYNQLNKWLEESGYRYNIECMYHTVFKNEETGHGLHLPKEVFFYSDSKEKTIPILINVQKNKDSKTHLVAAWLTNDYLILLDSMFDEMKFLKWEELSSYYESIYGVWIFQHQDNQSGYICFEANKESHINQETFTAA